MHWMPAIFVVLSNICRCHQKNVTQKNTVFLVFTLFYLNGLSIVKSLWSRLIFFNVLGVEQFWKLFYGEIKL